MGCADEGGINVIAVTASPLHEGGAGARVGSGGRLTGVRRPLDEAFASAAAAAAGGGPKRKKA
jgi:hypothetical protein